jgi:hypothetical protein
MSIKAVPPKFQTDEENIVKNLLKVLFHLEELKDEDINYL